MSARATSRAHVLVAAALFLSGASAFAPQARAQSLADVAKKEEERRKSVAAPAKVYTNKDLNPVPAGSPPPPAPAKAGDGAAKDKDKEADSDAKSKGSKAPDAADKTVVKDQAYWAGKYKESAGCPAAGSELRRRDADAHQFAERRFREPRRPCAEGGDRTRPAEGARRACPPETKHPGHEESDRRLRGRSAPRGRPARLDAVTARRMRGSIPRPAEG